MVGYPVLAITGTPLPFDAFTATDGEISVPCADWIDPQGNVISVSCGQPTLSDGMFQRQVTVSTADPSYNGTYLQFIITEPGVTGDGQATPFSAERGNLEFSNVDFIKMNNRGGGIASRSTIIDSEFDPVTNIEDRFVYESTYNYGAVFRSNDDPWVDTTQTISRLEYSPDLLTATELADTMVHIENNGNGVGPIEDNALVEIDQRMQMGDAPGDEVQKFKHTRIAGVYTELGTDVFGLINLNPLLPGGTNGGSVSWNFGNLVTATWVGYSSAAANDALFGYTQYANLGNNTDTSLVSLTDPEAANWNNIVGQTSRPILFGAVEAMSDITTPNPSAEVIDPGIAITTVRSDLFLPNTGTTSPPLTTLAFDPVYNNWRVDNGVFTADGLQAVACPVEASFCGEPLVNEDGLFQRLVIIAGEEYYQTIMVEGSVSGDPTAADFTPQSLAFKNETYIKAGSDGNGVASSLHMASRNLDYQFIPINSYSGKIPLPTDAGEFVYGTALNTGWANSGGLDPRLSVSQSVYVPEGAALDAGPMEATFTMGVGNTEADKRMALTSRVSTRDGIDSFGQPIMFASTILTGAYQNSSRTAIVDPFDPLYDPLLPGSGADLGWAAGDALKATWIGGHYATTSALTTIGLTSYTNLSTGDSISSASLESPDPDAWLTDPFGPAPVYP